eukprot:1873671-Rhodomonas_salina.2
MSHNQSKDFEGWHVRLREGSRGKDSGSRRSSRPGREDRPGAEMLAAHEVEGDEGASAAEARVTVHGDS